MPRIQGSFKPLPSKDPYFKAFGPKDPIIQGFLVYFGDKSKEAGCFHIEWWSAYIVPDSGSVGIWHGGIPRQGARRILAPGCLIEGIETYDVEILMIEALRPCAELHAYASTMAVPGPKCLPGPWCRSPVVS